jgi:hypothetical protein
MLDSLKNKSSHLVSLVVSSLLAACSLDAHRDFYSPILANLVAGIARPPQVEREA